MTWKRAALWIVIAAGIIAAIVFGMRPQPLEVETIAARVAPMETTVEEEGKTRLRDRFVVSAPIAGILKRHEWKVGDTLPGGRPIAYLTPLRAEILDTRRLSEGEARLQAASAAREGADARLRSAEQQLKAAEADATYWAQQLAREEKLLSGGDIPASRLDRTRAEVKRSEATRAAAEQAVAMARSEISRSRAEVLAAQAAVTNPGLRADPTAATIPVFSPVAGRVVRVARQSEGPVAPGEPILEIGNTRALEVEVELLSADAVKMAPGTRVRLTRWGGEGSLEARVRLVEPTGFTKLSALGVEEQRVRVIADITSPAEVWQRLGEGYRVEAAFVLWQGEKVLQIPASALFRDGEKWAVFVVEGSLARKRVVEVGHRNGLAAEVLSGVKEGERVVPHPDDKIADGAQVAAKK
jgi:HlyD family secretion protein